MGKDEDRPSSIFYGTELCQTNGKRPVERLADQYFIHNGKKPVNHLLDPSRVLRLGSRVCHKKHLQLLVDSTMKWEKAQKILFPKSEITWKRSDQVL